MCTDAAEVEAALDAFGPPYVVKDDGLAAGKGVVVTDDRAAAAAHAAQCDRVVIEEFLDGPEVSLFAITDGTTVYPLQPAQDFKRIFDGDAGARTPAAWAPTRRCRGHPRSSCAEVLEKVLQPTVDEMARRGSRFAGLLYAGLALTTRGLRVVEFNARFGDPETQPLMALLDSPLVRPAQGGRGRHPRRGRPSALEGGRGRGRRDGQRRLPGVLEQGRRDRRHRDARARRGTST